jgi:hypothetical protein
LLGNDFRAEFKWKESNAVLQVKILKMKLTAICTASIVVLMVEAVHASETSIYFSQTTWLCIPEGCHLPTRHHKNLKSQRFLKLQANF